jgi:hypothetical protein
MKLEYFYRVDPGITAGQARHCIVEAEKDLPRLRPKARAVRLLKIEAMKRDLETLSRKEA